MNKRTQEELDGIGRIIADAITEAIVATDGMMYRREDRPLVVVNVFIVEHGGNWSIGDAAVAAMGSRSRP